MLKLPGYCKPLCEQNKENYVASNAESVIEAYTTYTDGNGSAFSFGIFDDEKAVGFLMIGYDVDDSFDSTSPKIASGNYCI